MALLIREDSSPVRRRRKRSRSIATDMSSASNDVHELGLFTTDEMRRCFSEAGLTIAEYDPVGLIGRGLFVATAAPEE